MLNINGSINIKANKENTSNISVIGANIEGKDIKLDIANNLIVESLHNKEYSNTKSRNYGETAVNSLSGFNAIITAKSQGKNVKDISNEAYAGQIIGQNAVENNLTMYLEGTDLTAIRKEKESKEHSLEMAKLASDTFSNDPYKKVGTIFWKGENTKEGRTDTAYKLFDYIHNYKFEPGEPLNIVGHSHSGNIIKEFTNIYALPQKITNFNNLIINNKSN